MKIPFDTVQEKTIYLRILDFKMGFLTKITRNNPDRNNLNLKIKRQRYAVFMMERIAAGKIIWNFDQCFLKIGMCGEKDWSYKGAPAVLQTVAEGKIYTLFLESSGDYVFMVKDGFFNQYSTH